MEQFNSQGTAEKVLELSDLLVLISVKRRGSNVVLLKHVGACGHIWLICVLRQEALMFTITSFMIR